MLDDQVEKPARLDEQVVVDPERLARRGHLDVTRFVGWKLRHGNVTLLEAAGYVIEQWLPVLLVNQDDVELAVARIGVGGKWHAWPGEWDVHHLDGQVVARSVGAIELDLPVLDVLLGDEIAQQG